MLALLLRRLFVIVLITFFVAYPFAVVGIAFNVRSSFSLDWAGSIFLFLEGTVLLLAAMLVYGWARSLAAGLIIVLLSYIAETVGVGTGFPFGLYSYTHVLFPTLPGSVPLPVMFAWMLIVLGAYGCVRIGNTRNGKIGFVGALFGALFATLLDLEIEPVAFHIEHYWEWFAPGRVNYYGIPLANFVAWFVIALLLLLCVDAVFHATSNPKFAQAVPSRLALVAPRILFLASLFMFGLIDLTHGYYGAVIPAVLVTLLFIYAHYKHM